MILLLLLLGSSFVSVSAQDRRPLIAVSGIMHESDTFNPAKTGIGDFTHRRTAPRDQALAEWSQSNDEISGYIDGRTPFFHL